MTQTSNIKSELHQATFNPCETSTMIQQLQSTLDFRDVKLIALCELQTTTRVCAAFESAKLIWTCAPEVFESEGSKSKSFKKGLHRRWLIFVTADDFELACEIVRALGLNHNSSLPVPYVSEALCPDHDYQIKGLTHCCRRARLWRESTNVYAYAQGLDAISA